MLHYLPVLRRSPLATTARLLKAEDLYDLPADFLCELVDGVLIELSPVNPRHGKVQLKFGHLLASHVWEHKLGEVMVEVGVILRRDPDTVRAPDVAFVRAEHVPADGVPETFWELAPDLAVEVRSPNNTPAEIQAKVREYIEAGTPVLLLDSAGRTAEVVRSLTDRRVANVEGTLDLNDIVPGFSCRVADIFD